MLRYAWIPKQNKKESQAIYISNDVTEIGKKEAGDGSLGGEEMKIEVRGNQVILDGYVNVVDRESRMLPSPRGYFKERIVPKAFEKALKKARMWTYF